MENIVIRDWLSFTIKDHDPHALKDELGLGGVSFQETKGARGYRDRLYFEGISIHYNGRPDMGVWVEMSGQGCRSFETYSEKDWPDVFSFIKENGCHITRLDIAYDDHTGILPISRIVSDTQSGLFVSRSTYWQTTLSSKGTTVNIGSPQSKVQIRIYDKAAERGKEGEHWVRCELQLRDDRALAFSELDMPIGESFAGVVLNYLRYVEPGDDSNKSRWQTTDYWAALIQDATRISVFRSPGIEYNEQRLKDNIQLRWGNAIDCAIKMYGYTGFKDLIESREVLPNPKYEALLQRHYLDKLLRRTSVLFGGFND